MRYYSWHDRWRFRAWKHRPGIRIQPSGGHLPIFPREIPVRLSPTRFMIRHYSIRSYEHGRKKAFQERLKRYSDFDKKFFGLKRYEAFQDSERYFVIDPGMLTRYDEDGRWNFERKFLGWRKAPSSTFNLLPTFESKCRRSPSSYSRFCMD